jgi:hypothetical protein
MFISIVAFYFLPESPRWLLLNGRIEDAQKVLESAIKTNGGTWPEGFQLHKAEKDSEEKSTM